MILDGELLRERRTDLGLSQSGLADVARLGVRTVRTAEKGEPVSPDTAKEIASALGLSYIELLRPSPRMVRERLEASGLAPVRPRESWLPIDEEALLSDALIDSDEPFVCVEGPDGIGKSTLVRRVVEDLADRFPDGSVWVSAPLLDAPDRRAAVQVEIAEALGFSGRLPDPTLVAPEAFDQAFGLHFWRGQRLLVLDDVRDPDVLAAFTEGSVGRVVLTTSRRWVAESVDALRIRLPEWDREAIVQLIGSVAGKDRLTRDPEGTEELLELVGSLPLYARLAATGLQRARYRTLHDYVAQVRVALADEGSDARQARDPMVRGLLESVAETLSPDALQAVRDLALAGPLDFGEMFAVNVLGHPPAQARGVLDELADAYLLRHVETDLDETRFQIADWAFGAWGEPSDAAVTRLLRGARALIGRWGTREPDAMFENLRRILPNTKENFRQALPRLAHIEAPARSPAELPSIIEPLFPGMELMPEILVDISPLLRFAPPMEAGLWLTGAAAVSSRSPDRAEHAGVAWLLGWWWMLRGEDLGPACAWAEEAVDASREGDPELAVSIALHTCILERARVGHPGAVAAHQRVLALAETVECSVAMRSSALIHAAASAAFGSETPDWARARDLCDEAARIAGADPDPRAAIVAAAARIDRAVAQAALGETPTVDTVLDDVRQALGVLRADALISSAAGAVLQRLGVTDPLEVPDARASFLHVEPHEGEAVFQHLLELLGQLGATDANPDDSLRHPVLGHLSAWDVSGFPLGPRPGLSFVLFLPLEPVRALLTGDCREPALRFVATVRSEDHPAYRALQSLAET